MAIVKRLHHVLKSLRQDVLKSLRQAWNTRPTAVSIPLIMIPTGAGAVIFGTHVSRAFTNLGGGAVIRILGLAMSVGGLLVMISVVRDDVMLETIGLALAAFGAMLFGIGVLLGLGLQGYVAGLLSVGIALGFLGRIRLLLKASSSYRCHRNQ